MKTLTIGALAALALALNVGIASAQTTQNRQSPNATSAQTYPYDIAGGSAQKTPHNQYSQSPAGTQGNTGSQYSQSNSGSAQGSR